MFIKIEDKEGELSWINLKQVLTIKLGRPSEGWIWIFSYRNDRLWSQIFDSREKAEEWLENKIKTATRPGFSDIKLEN